ncbi:MAG: SurA N-terminal domain-containing protein [Bacteroidales bacterium]
MAVLEKIRVKFGAFITLLIGVALLSFIIDADTLRSAISMFSSKYDIGEMNGKAISYQDFQKKIDYYTKIHELATGSSTMDEEAQEMVNQSAWQELISENVLIPAVETAGIAVGDDEMLDLTQGSQISPVLLRERSFIGSDGQFDRNMLVQFIKAIPQDNSGNLSTYWKYLESSIKNEQMVTKYISLLAKSNIANPVELRRSIEENNVTSDVSFIIQPYGISEDSTIVVTKQEIKNYYNKYKNNFEQDASRDIEYVVYEVVPSLQDINLAQADINKVYDEFASTSNLKMFLARNSDKPLDNYYYKAGELASISPILDSFAFKANRSSVLPVYQEGNIFRAARINSIRQIPDSIYVQHILIQNNNKTLAKAQADSLIKAIEGGADFSEVAAANSLDKNPNAAPGELGWMTQSYNIPGFDTCFYAAPNKLFTLESNYGLHIVRVKERTTPVTKVQLAILEKSAVASKETYQSFYSKASNLVSKSDGKIESFNAAIKELNLTTVPANGIAEGAKTVATYKNARDISRWVYDAKTKIGDVSQIISVDNKFFFVVALTGIREEGIPELATIEPDITTILKREKANEKMVENVQEQVKGMTNMDEIAAKLGTTVNKQNGVSFGAVGSQSFDPKFVGSVAGAKVSTLVGPIGGNVGVYIFNVDARQTGAFFTEDDAKARKNQIFGYQIQMLPSILEKAADVKDHRAKFF